MFELITGGDYLFDPASGSRYSKDDDHIAQIMELMGEIPKGIAFSGKYSSEFFNRKGELRHINKLRYWPLEAVLHDKYLFPTPDADALASFLSPMLRLHPDKRAKAAELIHHNWLDGVVVQGEIDVIRRAEMEENERKGAGTSRSSISAAHDAPLPPGSPSEQQTFTAGGEGRRHMRTTSTVDALSQSEVDAMKPVGEFGGESLANSPARSDSRMQPPYQPGPGGPPRLGAAPVPLASSGSAQENARTPPRGQVQGGGGSGRGAGSSSGSKRRS